MHTGKKMHIRFDNLMIAWIDTYIFKASANN